MLYQCTLLKVLNCTSDGTWYGFAAKGIASVAQYSDWGTKYTTGESGFHS